MPVKETDPSDVRPTRESDIFSVGMLLLQVCEHTNTLDWTLNAYIKLFHGPDKMPRRGLPYNHIPSSSGYDIGMVKSIHAGERPRRTRYNQMEDKHWNLIRSCWDGEPSQRPTITQVRHALWGVSVIVLWCCCASSASSHFSIFLLQEWWRLFLVSSFYAACHLAMENRSFFTSTPSALAVGKHWFAVRPFLWTSIYLTLYANSWFKLSSVVWDQWNTHTRSMDWTTCVSN